MNQTEQIEQLKNRMRKMGCANYSINGLSEEESLLSLLREENSFKYAFVRCPYSRSKNLIWRLMKVDIWRPALPMGYTGSPGFLFDYLGENAIDEAIKIATLLMHKRYKGKQMDKGNDDALMTRATFKKVLDDKQPLTDEEKAYLDKRCVQALRWE